MTNCNANATNSIAKPTNSIAKPTNSIANGTNSIAIPTNSIANGTNSIAKATNSIAKTCNLPTLESRRQYLSISFLHNIYHQRRGGSRVWKEGGHLSEKQLKTKKKKKVTAIIASYSYPLPTISRLLCKIKSYL